MGHDRVAPNAERSARSSIRAPSEQSFDCLDKRGQFMMHGAATMLCAASNYRSVRVAHTGHVQPTERSVRWREAPVSMSVISPISIKRP